MQSGAGAADAAGVTSGLLWMANLIESGRFCPHLEINAIAEFPERSGNALVSESGLLSYFSPVKRHSGISLN
jgi:hypothetical protein